MLQLCCKEGGFGSHYKTLRKEYDFIIVGQGLAGTCLANELLDKNKRILVIDSPGIASASKVAGGIFNPITGRNMVLTWKADELFPFLIKYYQEIGQKLGVKILNQLPLYRPFGSMLELNEWQGKSSTGNFSPYIDFISASPFHSKVVSNDLGGIMLKQTGYLDTRLLLSSFRKLLREKELLMEEEFLANNLNFEDNFIVYKENQAKKLIFCDGANGIGNNLLKGIRFHSVKGEVLQLQLNGKLDFILNKNAFVLPRNGEYLAGSNYNLTDSTWNPTQAAEDEIVTKLDKILSVNYKIIGHRAGIRPTTHDRRPVLGILPNMPQVGVFNGLGTKGVSLAPYFAHQLANHLVNGAEIDREVQIGRYIN